MSDKKLNELNALLKELVSTQTWLLDNNKEKKPAVANKIAYLNSVKEYLLYGITFSQHARSQQTYFLDSKTYYYLLEDIANKDLNRFIRKVNRIAFDTMVDLSEFRYLESRVAYIVESNSFVEPDVFGDIVNYVTRFIRKFF